MDAFWLIAAGTVSALKALSKSIRESDERAARIQAFDTAFLASCRVASEIASIYERAEDLVLARRTDGRWGIASSAGWHHRGQAKYIASKWREITGIWPYIPF